MGEPTYMLDDAAVTARALEVTAADFLNGCNLAGSNAPAVGINMNEGAIVGTPEQFTLEDQFEVARTPQTSQYVGGFPFVDRVAAAVPYPGSGGVAGGEPHSAVRFGDAPTQAAKDADPALDGTIIPIGNSTLVTLAGGWVIQP